MASAPRLYLFHGADTHGSLEALHRWEAAFLQKYGIATRFSIEADESSLEEVNRIIAQQGEGISLFPEPKLILIKRLSAHEKGKAGSVRIQAILKEIGYMAGSLHTVVVWEDRLLSNKSGIFNWFTEQSEAGKEKITLFNPPSDRELPSRIQKYVTAAEGTIEPDAIRWLGDQYRQQEKVQRIAAKLRSMEPLPQDRRIWWLYGVLDQAILLGNRRITLGVVQACNEVVEGISVFEVINACKERQWVRAHELFARWQVDQDDTGYFGLWSLLRLALRGSGLSHSATEAYGLRLLAEVEIAAKNTTIPYDVLTETLLLRLREGKSDCPLIEPRTLWLSTLPLS